MSKSKLEKLNDSLNLIEFRSKRDRFYEELAASIRKKEQLITFFTEELKIAKNKRTRNSSREAALKLMRQQLVKGEDYRLSRILGTAMPQSDKMMLVALDDANDKPATLEALARAIREQREAKSVVLKAVLPPMILLPGVAGFSYVLATQSIPIIVDIAPPQVWTPFNQAVRSFAETISEYGQMIVLAIVAILIGFSALLPRWKGKLRSKLEQLSSGIGFLVFPVCPFILPLIIYRDFQVNMLMTSLAVMLKAGNTLSDSITQLSRNSSPWMRWHLKKIAAHLNISPTEYVPAFSKGLMSPSLLSRVATTIRTNPKFDLILIELGTTGSVEVREEIAKTSKSLNLLLMVIAGAFVTFLYVGQLSITNTMSDVMSNPAALSR